MKKVKGYILNRKNSRRNINTRTIKNYTHVKVATKTYYSTQKVAIKTYYSTQKVAINLKSCYIIS